MLGQPTTEDRVAELEARVAQLEDGLANIAGLVMVVLGALVDEDEDKGE